MGPAVPRAGARRNANSDKNRIVRALFMAVAPC
jgi:hypothetical protein